MVIYLSDCTNVASPKPTKRNTTKNDDTIEIAAKSISFIVFFMTNIYNYH